MGKRRAAPSQDHYSPSRHPSKHVEMYEAIANRYRVFRPARLPAQGYTVSSGGGVLVFALAHTAS